ncbi:Mur ligase family protein [Brevibacillus borstelensis]|uniref:Mur ligase family protein n=1 Tax=Brevibacillus borstelensis TaxID=45462 RepID=UPI003CC91956
MRLMQPVIAVTGSVGKTTTKEMIASILSTQFTVYKSKGNRKTGHSLQKPKAASSVAA